jgi:hypothetical protein
VARDTVEAAPKPADGAIAGLKGLIPHTHTILLHHMLVTGDVTVLGVSCRHTELDGASYPYH